MRIPIPFGYDATVITSGGNEADRRYRETVLVDVPEFVSGELPAVLTWVGSRHRVDWAHVTALHHDGALYEPATFADYKDGEEIDSPVTLEGIESAIERRMDEWGHLARPGIKDVFVQEHVRRAFPEREPSMHHKPPKSAAVVETDRPRRLSEAQAAARDFLVVGGAIYRRVPEPVLIASEKDVSVGSGDGHPVRNLFRLDQLDEALERACLLGGLGRGAIKLPTFKLLRPDLLAADLEEAALRDTAEAALLASAQRMATLPVAGIEAHFDLAEALDPKRTSWDEPVPVADLAEVVRLGVALCDGLAASHPDCGEVRACLHGFERAAGRFTPDSPRP